MTATLEELRRLKEARQSGEIDPLGYASERRALIESVETVEPSETVDVPGKASPHDVPDTWRMALFLAGILAAFTLIGTWLFRDLLVVRIRPHAPPDAQLTSLTETARQNSPPRRT